MPTVTVHFGGWVQLPERMVRSLGLTTGDRLAAELEGERIVLRRAEGAGERAAEASTGEAEEAAPAAEQTETTAATRPKARGRRKAQPEPGSIAPSRKPSSRG